MTLDRFDLLLDSEIFEDNSTLPIIVVIDGVEYEIEDVRSREFNTVIYAKKKA